MACPPSELILHFDINKTIIISDPAGGMTTEAMVNSCLAESCWGTRGAPSTADNPVGWSCFDPSLPPSEDPPGPAPGAQLVTFGDAVEHLQRDQRHSLKGHFTEEGFPGAPFRATYEELMTLMAIPETARECGVDALCRGRCFILPSFFNLIKELHAAHRSFAVVFRTFGVDIPMIAEEWNLFCHGQHPLHPEVRMDGSDGSVDRCLVLPLHSAKIIRSSEEAVLLAQVDPRTNLVQCAQGMQGVFRAITRRIAEGARTLAVSDDYDHWSRMGETATSGKLHVVVQHGAQHHIFFDDNIERDHAHIVDVRDHATGAPIAYADALGQYMVRALPLEAIRDPRYFISAVQRCEECRAARLAAKS